MKHGELSLEDLSPETCIPEWKDGMVLAMPEDVVIRRYDMPEESFAIFNKASGLELEVEASFQPLLGCLDGRYSAPEVIDKYVGDSGHGAPSGSGLEMLTQSALRRSTNELLQGMVQQGFLVERPSR
jgi:hypothetical protein